MDQFKITNTQSSVIIDPENKKRNLSSMNNEEAKELWDKGWPYVSLTKKGAKEHFGDLKASELADLIMRCKKVEDVIALQTVKPSTKTVKEAVKKRLEMLSK